MALSGRASAVMIERRRSTRKRPDLDGERSANAVSWKLEEGL